MNCLNVKNPLVQQELSKLSAILGDASAAYAALALNNGFGLDKAKNGLPSKLFESIKTQLQNENPYLSELEIYALSIQKKAACYTTEFREWFGDWLNSSDNISLEMSDLIDLVFARNPELAKIGSKQEYAAYLNSIYPNSADKSIYWHGSNSDFSQGFDSAVRGKGSGSPHITGEFYLAKQAWTVLQYVNGINRSFGPDINGFNHWNKLWWELKEIMSNGRRHNNDWKDLVIGPEHVRQAIPNKHGLFNRDSGGTNGKWLAERKADYGYQDRTDAEFFKDVFGIEYGKDTFNTWTLRNAEIFKSLQGTAEGIYPAIINTQSPIMESGENTYYEPERGLFTQAKTNGNDAILGANTDNEFHSDVAVVLNPSQQVHFLGTELDLADFQQWVSKNGVSKVIDENGEPLIVYTGTPVKGIEEFSLEVEQRHNLTSLLDRRIYFTDYYYIADEYTQGKITYYTTPEVNEEQAKLIDLWYWSGELADIPSNREAIKIAEQQIGLSYAQIRKYIEDHRNEYTGELNGFHMERGEVIPAFLNIKNPAIVQHNGTSIANLTRRQIKEINLAEGAIILNVDEAHVGDYMSLTTNDYLVKSSNLIKSALHNKGSYSQNSKNIYYQVSLAQELKKLSSYNRPLGPAGNTKKQREILLKTGANREVVDLILELLKRNPALGKFTPVEILRLGTKSQNDAIAADYYHYIQQPVEHALEQHLIQYLSKYGIEVREDSPLLKEHGVTGAYDIINKIIHIAKEGDRNAITLTEEFAHAFVELMGVVPNTNRKGEIIPDLENSPHNYDISLLLKEVEKTSIYQKVFNEYKDIYTTPDGQPDILKIKKEAIGQALAVAIQNNWNIQQENESKGFWQVLKEWWYSIISRFKDAEYLNFDTLVNQIAKEVLNNDTSRLDKVDSSNYLLLKYTDTIVNLNAKDGGKALGFMRYFTEIGNLITGSLSYRMLGEVYRGALDSLHDIDMIVPRSAHGIDLQSDEIKSVALEINRRRYGGVKDNTDLLIQFPYFHRIVTMYPKLKLGSCFASNDGSFYTINGVYAENESLSEKFLSLSGSYSTRLEAFTEEERSLIYLFDFFLKPTDAAIETAVYDDLYSLKLAPYETSLKEKLFNMGRAKDIFDYQMWRTYDKFKERYIPEKETLMFLKPKDSKNIYTKFIAHVPSRSQNTEYVDSVLFDLSKNYLPLEDGSTVLPLGDLIDTISSWNRSHVKTVFNMMSLIRHGSILAPLENIKIIVLPESLYLEHNVDSRAFYDALSKIIYINRDALYTDGVADEVILHEIMHALTVDRIFTDAELAKRFYTIFQEYQSAYPYDIRYEGNHGFEEFIANIWSDPLTISNLRKVKSPRKAKWSLWQEIRSFLYDVFYLYFGGSSRYDTLFAEASTLMLELFDKLTSYAIHEVYTDTTLKGYVNHTGPKQQSDSTAWNEIGKQYGVKTARSTKSVGPLVEIFEGTWTREQVAKLTGKVFLFGDNTDDRVRTKYVPSKTLAVIRNLPNAIGIDTKKDRGVREPKIAGEGKMTFSYGNLKRSEIRALTTLDAIKNGERTATTRYESDGHIQHWAKFKVGDIIKFTDAKGGVVYVKITKPLTKLSLDTNAEEWSKKEGWSVEYFNSKVLPRINEAYQIEYELISPESSYFTDADFGIFKALVDQAIEEAKASGKTIVIPAAGIGTGKAELKERAPKLFNYLQERLANLASNELSDDTQAVFIIGDFNPLRPLHNQTLTAVNKAKSKGVDLYVFDQTQTRKWYRYIPEYQSFITVSTPSLPKNFTGIVTTNLNKIGKRAIDQVYKQTITKNNKAQEDISKENKPLGQLTKEAKNNLALMAYLYKIEGFSEEMIKERQAAFLQGDKEELNTVRRFWELGQMRQAELHVKGRDFGIPKTNSEGVIDFDNWLKGIDLRKSIKDLDASKFIVLRNYKVHPAEIIMPKLYRSNFKLGNKDIAEIDLNFFKKTNPYYQTNLKDKNGGGVKIDALIRTHTSAFNIMFVESFDDIKDLKWSHVDVEVENGWRVDAQGNRMYKIPDGLTYAVYKEPKGQEILVVLNSSPLAEKLTMQLIRSVRNIVSMLLFAENITPTREWVQLTKVQNKITTNNRSLGTIDFDSWTPEQIREFLLKIYKELRHIYTNDLANVLYNSFIKSLKLISVRIPTQDFQSIMATRVVSLTNDDANNIFVTRWQFWLQGSDLDIDKSYLMGVDLSSTGRYNHWSPLADYSSETLAEISEKLPIPNGKTLVTADEWYKASDGEPMLIKPILYENAVSFAINEYLEAERSDKKEKRLEALVAILNLTNSSKELEIHKDLVDLPAVKTLIQLVNKHNEHEVTAEESRNIILKSILDAALDERNMRSSYSPIDVVMKKFQSVLDNIEDVNALSRNLDDGGLSIARMQYNNSVGKKDVGIMANGLKAFFALTLYFNLHKHDLDNKSEIGNRFMGLKSYFLSRVSLAPGKDNYFSSISDVLFEEIALLQLKTAFATYLPTIASSESLTFSTSDASLLISSLVSLATDNAKELALAKMNASIDLACMHLFLVVMGYNPLEIITFTTSPVFNKVVKVLNSSAINGKGLNVRDAISAVLLLVLSKEEAYLLEQMRFIYDCAQEMSKIAKLAAINLGVKVDELEMDKFCSTIEEVIDKQVEAVLHRGLQIQMRDYELGLGIEESIDISTVPEDETIKLLVKNTHNYLIDSIDGILNNNLVSDELILLYKERIADLNVRNKENRYMENGLTIDMVRFYTDNVYRQFVIDLYDVFKCNFNVLDCISSLPHFDKMLEAFVLSAHTIKTQSSRSKVILKDAKQAYRKDIDNYYLETKEDEFGESRSVRKKGFERKSFGMSTQRLASKFYDDFILSEWIKEHGELYKIRYKAGDETNTINISTNKGVAKFANFMAFNLIPIIKQLFPTNLFLRHIHGDFRSLRYDQEGVYIPKYAFDFDIDTLVSTSDENKAFYVNKDFAKLAELTLGELQEIANSTLDDFFINFKVGSNLKLGELFYLYDRICSASSFGQNSLDRAFETYLAQNAAKSKELIAYLLVDIIKEHDTGLRPPVVFDDTLFTAYCYASLIRKYQNGIASFIEDGKKIDITGMHLFNLDIAEKQKDALLIAEKFTSGLKDGSILPKLLVTPEGSKYILTFKNDSTFELAFPNIGNSVFSVEGLILSLLKFTEEHPDKIKQMTSVLAKTPPKRTILTKPLKSHQTRVVYKIFKEHMAKLGVEVKTYKGTIDEHGYVDNGIIYLNENSDITTTPMHELLHLVFGVMKHDSFESYERVLELTYKSDHAKELYRQLSANDNYKNLMDLDLKEEVFCRLIEAIVDPDNDLTVELVFTSGTTDTYNEINDLLNPFISKTFDIDAPKELILFMKDTISSITSYNSTLFIKRKADSTGYLSEKTKSIQSAKIAKYIEEEMVAKNALKKVDC